MLLRNVLLLALMDQTVRGEDDKRGRCHGPCESGHLAMGGGLWAMECRL